MALLACKALACAQLWIKCPQAKKELAMIATLVPLGIAITLAGLALLGSCIVAVIRARRAGLSDEEMKARLQKLVAVNLGALAVAGIGLMCVVTGLFLT